MNLKQDRQGVRTPADIERKYDLGQDYKDVIAIANNAQKSAERASTTANNAKDVAEEAKRDVDELSAMISNQNILNNWYFANSVNQRGQTKYNGNGYTIDRWRMDSDGGGIAEIVDDGIKLSFKTIYGRWEQLIEDYHLYAGKEITFSVLFSNVSAPVYIQVTDGSGTISDAITEPGLYSVTKSVSKSPSKLNVMFQRRDGNLSSAVETCTVIAAKMEFGSKQTLAHEEDGVWVLNDTFPIKGIETLKCCVSRADSTDTYANKVLQ